MKKVLLFLAAAGLASASAISLNTFTALADSQFVSAPGTRYTPTGANGTVGGLCVGIYSNCPTVGFPGTDVLTFTLGPTANLEIFLQDYFTVGDQYEVVLYNSTNTPIGHWDSSSVLLNGNTPQACYIGTSHPAYGHDASVANVGNSNSCLDVFTGPLAAGNYSISVWDILLSNIGGSFGGGTPNNTYEPATFAMVLTPTAAVAGVPEPGTFALLGLGGIALGLIRRRIAK